MTFPSLSVATALPAVGLFVVVPGMGRAQMNCGGSAAKDAITETPKKTIIIRDAGGIKESYTEKLLLQQT